MSADNWAKCPQCKRDHEAAEASHAKALLEAYGKVSRDEYIRLLEQSKAPVKLEPTLREDYEIGIYRDELFIDYTGQCKVCGFQLHFKHTQPALKET